MTFHEWISLTSAFSCDLSRERRFAKLHSTENFMQFFIKSAKIFEPTREQQKYILKLDDKHRMLTPTINPM